MSNKLSEQDWEKFRNLFLMKPKDWATKYTTTATYAATHRSRVKKRIIGNMERLNTDPEFQPTEEQLAEMESLRQILAHFAEKGLPVSEADAEFVERFNTWEMGSKDADGNPQVTILRGITFNPRLEAEKNLVETYEPAQPAKITPTRRRRQERVGKKILAFADTQIGYRRIIDPRTDEEVLMPIHSEPMLSIIQQLNADIMPELTVNLSDTIDLSELSRFDPDSDSFHRTLGPSFQRVHDFYAQLIADNPDGRYIEVDSNHTARPTKALLKKMPELYGFTLPGEDYPLITYYRLADLGSLGIDFRSGYGGAKYVHGEEYDAPPIIFKHGNTASSVPGANVRKEQQQNPDAHVVRGHGHSYEAIAHTTREGRQLYYYQIGAACLNSGPVPSFQSSVDDFGFPVETTHNWQNQLAVITDYEDGSYQFDIIDVFKGVARYNDTTYDGNPTD